MPSFKKQKYADPKILGPRALAAISAVEGLKLGPASRRRLLSLQNDPTLTPDQRRAEVRKAHAGLMTASMVVMEPSTGLED